MHKVLVNRLGSLSLPRKSVVRLTDRPGMTLDVHRGCKTTMQQQISLPLHHGDCEMGRSPFTFDPHRRHMSELFFRPNRPEYPHPVFKLKSLLTKCIECALSWKKGYQSGGW